MYKTEWNNALGYEVNNQGKLILELIAISYILCHDDSISYILCQDDSISYILYHDNSMQH